MIISAITSKEWQPPSGPLKKFVHLTIDGKEYACWQQLNLKVGDTVEGQITVKGEGKTPQIKISTLNGSAVAQAGAGGKSYGKSPEELELQKKTMALAYAKDQINAVITAFAPLLKELPVVDGHPVTLSNLINAYSKLATTITVEKYEEFLKKIS